MNWGDLAKTVGKAAPLLGAALGGPAGGAVGAIVSSALGVNNDAAEISAAISSDPTAAIKLRTIENQHREELARLTFETLQAELADKQNARKEHKHSRMPAVITIAMTMFCAVWGTALFTVDIPVENRDMVSYFGGQMIALWVSSVVYWVGTSRSSAEKNRWAPSD